MAVVHLSVQRQDQGLESLPRRESAGPLEPRARATGLGRELWSRDPCAGRGGGTSQPEAPTAQPANCTASKQRAPTGQSWPPLPSTPSLGRPGSRQGLPTPRGGVLRGMRDAGVGRCRAEGRRSWLRLDFGPAPPAPLLLVDRPQACT